MSEISDLLWLKAQELQKAASNKSAEWQMVKSAAVSSLESKGVNSSDATALLEKLAERAYPNLKKDQAQADQLAGFGKLFEKAAQYVSELEVKLSTKEEEIVGLHKAASRAVKAPSVNALSGTGAFTNEDLETLSNLDDSMLSKVAGLADKTPWNLGEPSNRISGGLDALTEFLTS
jgi:hypothetical protein